MVIPEQMELFEELVRPASLPIPVWELRPFFPFDIVSHLNSWSRQCVLSLEAPKAVDCG